MLAFEINDEDQVRIETWLKETVYPAEIAKQKKAFDDAPKDSKLHLFRQSSEASWAQGRPSSGAIGGGLVYKFCNTTIGQVQKVSYGDHELDLTDYSSW